MATLAMGRKPQIHKTESILLFENRTREALQLRDTDVGYLEDLRQKYARISIRGTPEGYKVRFEGLCGTPLLPSGAMLNIRPKIPVAVLNLLAWRAKCPELLDLARRQAISNFPEFLLRGFADLTARLLRQGLLQRYVTRREVLSKLRGRLWVQEELRQVLRGSWHRLACEYDDLTFDCLENRVLCRAAYVAGKLLLGPLPGAPDVRKRLIRLFREMAGLGISHGPVDLNALGQINFTRLNQHYRPALILAEIILRHITLKEYKEDHRNAWQALPGFLIDTAELFEEAVAEGLKWAIGERWREITVEVQAKGRHLLQWGHDRAASGAWEREPKRRRRLYRLRPDIALKRGRRVLAVLDTKYKPLRRAEQEEEDPRDLEEAAARTGALREQQEAEEMQEGAHVEPGGEGGPGVDADVAQEHAGGAKGTIGGHNEDKVPARADAYQMLAYCIGLGTDKALLIYPAQREDAPSVQSFGPARTPEALGRSPTKLWWLQVNCAAPHADGQLPLARQWRALAEVVVEQILEG